MILITGGNGFIGKGFAETLTRRRIPFRLACRTEIRDGVAVGDIDGSTNWKTALDGISCVVHLAGLAHQTRHQPPIERYRQVNVEGSLRLAEEAASSGVRRMVFVSSIGVLGLSTFTGEKLSELSTPSPQTAYAISKLEAEVALASMCRSSHMNLVIVRPPLVYGRDAKGNFAKLRNLVASGYPLPFRSVRNRRNIISLQNLSAALVECACNPLASDETFLVAEQQAVSTAEIVCAIAAGLRREPRLMPFPVKLLRFGLAALGRSSMAEGLLDSLEIDASKITQKLGWSPSGATLENIERELLDEL